MHLRLINAHSEILALTRQDYWLANDVDVPYKIRPLSLEYNEDWVMLVVHLHLGQLNK